MQACEATPNCAVTYIPRNAESWLSHFASAYPELVTTATPVRKVHPVQYAFPGHRQVSQDDLDPREFSETDPCGFLNQFSGGINLGEAQRCAALLTLLPIAYGELQRQIRLSTGFFRRLDFWRKLTGEVARVIWLICGGEIRQTRFDVTILPWHDIDTKRIVNENTKHWSQ
jgi:hypothetical protein